MFGSSFKWVEKYFSKKKGVEKQSPNFPYLACCKIELFYKNI